VTASAGAWSRLIEGNRRFAAGRSTRLQMTRADRAELLNGQAPWAAVLSCSDSRVPPEIVLDTTAGELFVVRSAGHVLDPVSLGSLIYAVDHLRVPVVVILGHSDCGAVKAAISWLGGAGECPSRPQDVLCPIIELIAPAISLAGDDATVDAVAREHAGLTRQRLLDHLIVSKSVEMRAVDVCAAFYDLSSGLVNDASPEHAVKRR